ncbi:hypothetical protein QYF61_013732 [Mycteria americana]|uniref:Uncharacterized protein n=1 Tax=Mycteria americana TaxID=33587 RepID=A0AAN7NNT7_MYCAM|nr:hypothetical protein QYF61_013732 [Mycteria americana]
MDGWRLFGKERPGWQGRRVALLVREQQECMELCLGMDGGPDGRLRVRTGRQTNMGDIVVPEDWKKANVTPVFEKNEKENPGNYRLDGLTLILENIS